MYILRGTQKLLTGKHLTRETIPVDPTPPTTTALGDWYAHRLIVDRQHLAICVSERSRLCVITTARDLDNLPQRLYYALVDLLRSLDVPEGALTEEAIARERREMQEMRYGPATGTSQGRSVVGTINDYSNALRYAGLEGRSLAEWNLHLSQWICGPLRNERPHTASARLLQEALAREPLALA